MGQRNSTYECLNENQIKNLSNITKLKESQIRQCYTLFCHEFPKGSVTLQDFIGVYSRMFKQGDPNEFATKVFREMDKDRNEGISFHEFMCSVALLSFSAYDDRLRWIYNLYDENKDGLVTKTEVLNMIEAIYKMIGSEYYDNTSDVKEAATKKTEEIFRKMDKDGDGFIDVKEFITSAKLDPNLLYMSDVK